MVATVKLAPSVIAAANYSQSKLLNRRNKPDEISRARAVRMLAVAGEMLVRLIQADRDLIEQSSCLASNRHTSQSWRQQLSAAEKNITSGPLNSLCQCSWRQLTSVVVLNMVQVASLANYYKFPGRSLASTGPKLSLIVAILVLASNGRGAAAGWLGSENDDQDLVPSGQKSLSTEIETRKSSPLYECELSFLQVDLSLIKFSISYLQLGHAQKTPSELANETHDNETFELLEINSNVTVDELASNTTLDPKLPFVFFINGFNTFAPLEDIKSSWMFQVAKSFALRAQQYQLKRAFDETGHSGQREGENSPGGGLLAWLKQYFASSQTEARWTRNESDGEDEEPFASGRNVVFLTWSIPDLFASNLIAMIPAYYRTVANYDLIVEHVARTVTKFVHFSERLNKFQSARARSEHYSKFHFYGHSLGSHILSDAILRVVRTQNRHSVQQSASSPPPSGGRWFQFGKLMGLDPATPCFLSQDYGISSWRVREAAREVAVLHSNAGFAGVPNERANVEIVLNGGTFQPGCAWYDFTCSHVRSTDILSYVDDDCQMVAYKCTSYNHFKLGACEVCPDERPQGIGFTSRSKQGAGSGGHCALVNLPEQHRDRSDVRAYAELANNKTRQLAETEGREPVTRLSGKTAPATNWFSRQWSRYRSRSDDKVQHLDQPSSDAAVEKPVLNVDKLLEQQNDTKSKANYFHYVNTNENFRHGRKSHCLQHYQLRLLIYDDDEDNLLVRNKCKLSSFYQKSSIKLKLLHETAADNLSGSSRQSVRRQRRRLSSSDVDIDKDQARVMSTRIKLNPIVRDVFFTALVNFEAAPKLFVGAELENLDLEKLAECYKRHNSTGGGPKFVLDIAFMSHIRAK